MSILNTYTTQWRELSSDTIRHIGSFLDPIDVIRTGNVCKEWRESLQNTEAVQKIKLIKAHVDQQLSKKSPTLYYTWNSDKSAADVRQVRIDNTIEAQGIFAIPRALSEELAEVSILEIPLSFDGNILPHACAKKNVHSYAIVQVTSSLKITSSFFKMISHVMKFHVRMSDYFYEIAEKRDIRPGDLSTKEFFLSLFTESIYFPSCCVVGVALLALKVWSIFARKNIHSLWKRDFSRAPHKRPDTVLYHVKLVSRERKERARHERAPHMYFNQFEKMPLQQQSPARIKTAKEIGQIIQYICR